MIRASLCGLLMLPGLAVAQEIIIAPIEEESLETSIIVQSLSPQGVVKEIQEKVNQATGAKLRGLDKVSGEIVDLDTPVGDTVALGWLQITLGDCRYPEGNPSGDAFAWLVIRERNQEVPVFEGWMIASSPALSALDHSRFDVWVLRCTTE